MSVSRRAGVWMLVGVGCAGVVYASYRLLRMQELRSMTGAVLRQDADPGKQLPIADVQVSLGDGRSGDPAKSNSSGLFRLSPRPGVKRGDSVTLQLRHPDYQPMDIPEVAADRLYVIRMIPVRRAPATLDEPVKVGDVRVRYAVKRQNTASVGSAVKSFAIVNEGGVPCDGHQPCSPDGSWKATVGGASLDAGDGNVFGYARVTCLAGPCPFARIEKDAFSAGGRQISVLVRNWSDTVTFVLEAEVIHSSVSDQVLQSFPVILSQTMSFTLPASSQGPSIEASVNGEDIVYPLGPSLKLSWANCSVQVASEQTKLYRCVLKPGYQFR